MAAAVGPITCKLINIRLFLEKMAAFAMVVKPSRVCAPAHSDYAIAPAGLDGPDLLKRCCLGT